MKIIAVMFHNPVATSDPVLKKYFLNLLYLYILYNVSYNI